MQTPEVDESDKPKIEYTEEELNTLVKFIKNMTTLYDLREDDWSEKNAQVIREFFLTPEAPILTIFFDEESLTCTLGIPEVPVVDLTYFLREPMQIFDVKTFHDKINFGTMDDNIEGSILNIIENLYAPVFFKSDHWPESNIFLIISDFLIVFLL